MQKIGRALWEHEGVKARSTKRTSLAAEQGDGCALCPFRHIVGCKFDGKSCSAFIGRDSVFISVEPAKTEPKIEPLDLSVVPLPMVPVLTLKLRCTACGEMKVFAARIPSNRVTKELREAALNSKCWFCGKK